MDNKQLNSNQISNNSNVQPTANNGIKEAPTNSVNQSPVTPSTSTPSPTLNKPVDQSQTINNTNNASPSIPELPKLDQTVTTIGALKKDKQKSPVAMLILFTLLIVTIVFIPQITPYFSDLLKALNINTNKEIYEGVNEDQTPAEEEKEEQPAAQYYSIAEDTTITYDTINISSISKKSSDSGYYISFTLTNNDTKELNFQTSKYYLDLYDDTQKFIGSVLITNPSITSKQTVVIDNVISAEMFESATKLEVIKRTYEDYQPIVLSGNMLSCTLNNRSLIYTFVDLKLMAIDDKFTYIKAIGIDDEKYTNDYLASKSSIDKIDAVDNVSAAIIQTTIGYNTSVIIDYQTLTTDMSTYDAAYYAKDTLAKNIKYEMNSRGYTCQ